MITIDDRIPCKVGSSEPVFAKPNGNELWVILLEKVRARSPSLARLDTTALTHPNPNPNSAFLDGGVLHRTEGYTYAAFLSPRAKP